MRKSFILYTDLEEKLSLLDNEEVGKIFRATMQYAKTKTIPKLPKHLLMVFNFIKVDLDKNEEKYEEKSKKNRENALKRWQAKVCDRMQADTNDADNDNDIDIDNEIINNDNLKKENKKRKKFVKPTLKELKDYIREKDLNVDAEGFIDYYEGNGWKVGRNSMKDWKATVRNWSRRQKEMNQNKKIKEKKPDWYGKEIEEEIASEEEMLVMEEKISTIQEKLRKH